MPDPGDAGIFLDLKDRALSLVQVFNLFQFSLGIHHHRTEFIHRKQALAQPYPLLLEKHRTAIIKLDGEGHQAHHRRHNLASPPAPAAGP